MRPPGQWAMRTGVLGSALGLTIGVLSTPVEATSRRYTASLCQPRYVDVPHSHAASDTDFGIFNDGSSVLTLTCPLMHNTSVPNSAASKLTLVRVEGSDGNDDVGAAGAIVARVCRRSASAATMSCGSPRSSHDSDMDPNGDRKAFVKMTMGASHLGALGNSSTDIICLLVEMPPVDGISKSLLRSIYVSN